MRGPERSGAPALLAVLLLVAGCFEYVPMAGAPPRATRVRITLAAPADVPLARVVVRAAARVDGEVIEVRGDSIVLSALSVEDGRGVSYAGDGATVALGLSGARAEVRRLSAWRSIGAAGGAVALALLGSAIATEGGGTGSGGSPPGQSK